MKTHPQYRLSMLALGLTALTIVMIPRAAPAATWDANIAALFQRTSPEAAAAIRDALGSAPSDESAAQSLQDQVYIFYAVRDFAPAWSGGDDAEQNAIIVRE